jgi:hypothetical protein
MSKREIKAGATDQTVDVFVQDTTSITGAGLSGLVFNSNGLTCYYRKGATGSATALTLATQTVGGAHSDGGFVEIDATNMKGMYRLDLSDTMVAAAGMLTIMLRGAANMAPCPIEIEVVSVDKFDTVRGGMTALPNAAADAAGGLPISDAGGLDLDTKLANTNEVTPARMGALTDWIDGGRLDLIIDAILDDTDLIDDATSGLAKIATDVASILVDTGTTLQGDITAILADTNELQTDWVNGGRLDLILDARASQSSVDTIDGIVDAILLDTGTDGVIVASFTTAAKAELQTEATDALNAYDPPTRAEATSDTNSILSKLLKYFQLLFRKDAAIATDNATEVTAINADGGSGAGAFANTTDSTEAIRDRGDTAWTTAAGFSTHSAADVWAVATRVLTAGTNIVLVKGTGVTGFTDIDAAGVRTAVGLSSANLDTQLTAIVGDTNELQTDWADGGRLDLILDARASQTSVDALSIPSASAIATSVLTTAMTESYSAAGGTMTLSQGMYGLLSIVSEFSIAGTTITCRRLDGSTTSMTFTLDDDSSPTSRTRAT